MNLCALADVKTILDLSNTSQDGKLALYIKRVSAQIAKALNFNPVWTIYAGEQHMVNNRQLLQLNAQPIQAIASITLEGVALVPGTDFIQFPDNDSVGLVYRDVGWCGNYYTRGMMGDPVAGFPSVLVSYTAGWHLPEDPLFVEDDPGSLPDSISSAALQETLELFNIGESGGLGMQDHSEGKVKDTFRADAGLSQAVLDMIAPYRRLAVA